MKVPEAILSELQNSKRFLIATHINPDGDALGSSLALSLALEAAGKETCIYNRDRIPDFYRFLPGSRRFRQSLKNISKSDRTVILLDCNHPDRAEIGNYNFKKSVVIDHHDTESNFGDIRWVEKDAAATGIMVFYLIKALGIVITKEMAVNLYTAIALDTGTFRYSNTTSQVLRCAAELIESGAEPHIISEYLYDSWEEGRFRLLIKALNTLEIKNGVAIMFITRDMFKKTDTTPQDTENFSNFPRMIKGINLSALFRDMGRGIWRASLRSKGDVNVSIIAEINGGGGHKNAAGYMIKGDKDFVKNNLYDCLIKIQSDKKNKQL